MIFQKKLVLIVEQEFLPKAISIIVFGIEPGIWN
jgi:hypothetical protein